MRRTQAFKIAQMRGIHLKIHFSLLFLMAYIVFVATSQFQYILSDLGMTPSDLKWSSVTWSIIFAVSLFVSIALHEFGHALMAQRLGIQVRGITLMMLGGVSEMEQIPEKPYVEFKLSIIGPIVSFVIAGVLFWIRSLTASNDLYLFCEWLGSANLVLAVFNLLPAFPLDGGRALRSLLAVRQGQLRATQTSVRISRVFAFFLGIVGFLQFNILLMLIAIFIYATANSELYNLMNRGLLKEIKASEILVRVAPLNPSDSLDRVATLMIRTRQSALPVTPCAVVTLDQLRKVPRDQWSQVQVSSVMENDIKVIDIQTPINAILPELRTAPSGVLPVQENDQVVGLIRLSDLAEVLQLRSLETPREPDGKKAA